MNHLDLFSGIGGFSLAAEWAGMKTIAFVERDSFCQRVLAKHWPSVPCFGDIHDIKEETIEALGQINILTGGFPCQPFSVAGQQRGTDDDRYLWPQMLRIIKVAQPTWICGENVPGIINMALDQVCADLEGEGYEVQPIVLPACAVGAWHIRKRVFILAWNVADSQGRRRRLCVAENKRTEHREGDALGDGSALLANSDGTRSWSSCRNSLHERRSTGENRRTRLPQAARWEDGVAVDDVESTSSDAAYTDSERQQQPQRDVAESGRWTSDRSAWVTTPTGEEWHTEPDVGRMAPRLPGTLDRLRALGNAVVPQQVYPLLKWISEIHKAS